MLKFLLPVGLMGLLMSCASLNTAVYFEKGLPEDSNKTQLSMVKFGSEKFADPSFVYLRALDGEPYIPDGVNYLYGRLYMKPGEHTFVMGCTVHVEGSTVYLKNVLPVTVVAKTEAGKKYIARAVVLDPWERKVAIQIQPFDEPDPEPESTPEAK